MNLDELDKASQKNKAKLNKTLTQVKRTLNQAIKDQKQDVVDFNVRFYIILQVAWLESTLLYLIFHHKKQLNDYNRTDVLNAKTQVDKWDFILEYFFRKYYLNGKTSKEFNLVNVSHNTLNRYNYLKKLLHEEVKVFIEIRNKLAHGQWSVVLNSDMTGKSQELTTRVWTLTKKETWHSKNIIVNFSKLMEKLIMSQNAFELSFDDLVRAIETTRNLHGPNFQKVIDNMHKSWSKVEVEIKRKN